MPLHKSTIYIHQMEQLVTSEFKLGIIAGGQLGKMLVLAASNWDVKTFILDADEHCPASTCCTNFIKGNHLNFDDVYNFGKMVDMITFEIENVNIDALKKLKQEGKRINPDPDILEIIQDKGLQKQFYNQHDIPSPPFRLFNDKSDIENALRSGSLVFPFVQKLRKGGYDGRGVSVIKTENDLDNLLNGASVIEELVYIEKEISIIAARNEKGEVKCFPIVEMEFNEKANLVEKLICPASLNDSIKNKAVDLATQIISSLNLCGILAVEMFIDRQNKIYINEVAPRPHNSGHHTIESIITSQYEQLLRAIFNFPLGSTQLKLPSVMINLLGEPDNYGAVKYEGLTECMSIEGVKIHLYGKKTTIPFRKMGHVTILASTIIEAKEKAELVKQKLKVKAWKNR
jgi:5-(carboxyamino)imidazole ribonucleotide synthase